jgi:hypothetical protein
MFDARRQLGDFADEAFKDANQGADDLALGLGFGLTNETGWERRADGPANPRPNDARCRRAGP